MVGSENKVMTKFEFDGSMNSIERMGEYKGHTGAVRNIQVTSDCKNVITASEDHTIKVWDY